MTQRQKEGRVVLLLAAAGLVVGFGFFIGTIFRAGYYHPKPVVKHSAPAPQITLSKGYMTVMDGYQPQCKSGVLNTDKSDKYLLIWECRDHSFQAARVLRYGH